MIDDFTEGSMVGIAIDYDDGTNAYMYVDLVRIRKYVNPEPSVSIV